MTNCLQMHIPARFRALTLLLAVTASAFAQGGVEKEQPMAKDASPGFLVATIRPSDPNETREGFPYDGHYVSCIHETLAAILSIAYSVHMKQIVGAPEWMTKDRYDINGVPDVPGAPDLRQQQEMYQKLLADRFHLVFHRETREMPIYAITVAKGGPMLKPAGLNETFNAGNSNSGGQRTMKFRGMSMHAFALNLNFYEDRPVVDETSLNGRYDFTLTWTYDVSREGDPDAPPSLFTAIKDQLGLKMEAVRGPAEVLVIDHVERPSKN